MAIAFVGSTTFYTGTSNTETINVSLPNISNGDLWIVYYVEVAFTGTPTFEAGWQQLGTTSAPGGQLGATYILYRIREAGDNTTFVTTYPVGFGRQVCACAYGYSGTATNFPFDTDAIRDPFDIGTGTSPPSNALTTTTTNTMILRTCNFDDGDGGSLPISFPGGVTNRGSVDVPDTGAGNGGYMRCGEDGIQASAGSTGVATWTQSVSEGWTTNTIAIREASQDVSAVDNTLTGKYDILGIVSNTLTGIYDIGLAVSNTLTGVYDMKAVVSNILTGVYDMKAFVSNTLTGKYDILEFISNTLTGKYNILNFTSNNLTGKYNILNFISNTLTGVYGILDSVSNTLTGKYNILEFISNTLTGVYDMVGLVSNTLTGKYDMIARVSNTLTGLYDKAGIVGNTLTIKYDMKQRASNILTGIYDIFDIHKTRGDATARSTSGSKFAKGT